MAGNSPNQLRSATQAVGNLHRQGSVGSGRRQVKAPRRKILPGLTPGLAWAAAISGRRLSCPATPKHEPALRGVLKASGRLGRYRRLHADRGCPSREGKQAGCGPRRAEATVRDLRRRSHAGRLPRRHRHCFTPPACAGRKRSPFDSPTMIESLSTMPEGRSFAHPAAHSTRDGGQFRTIRAGNSSRCRGLSLRQAVDR